MSGRAYTALAGALILATFMFGAVRGLGPSAQAAPSVPEQASSCTSVDPVTGESLSKRQIIPDEVRICEPAVVSMTVKVSCGAVPLHVMLNLDRSGSMIGQPWEDAKAAAAALVRELDTGNNRDTMVGLITHGITPDLHSRLTNNSGQVLGALNRLSAGGEDNLPAAIDMSRNELVRTRNDTKNNPVDVLVLLTDGGQTYPPSQAVASAGRAKNADILVVAVCLENAWSSCPQVRQMASSPQYYFQAQGTAGLVRIFREIAADLRNVNLRQMNISETLPEGLAYVAGSGNPAPNVDRTGRILTWQHRFIPKEGVSLTYQVQPSDVTTYSVAISTVTFQDSQKRNGALSVPAEVVTVTGSCDVVIPTDTPTPTTTPTDTPTPTATNTPSATPTPTAAPGTIYLPILGLNRCIISPRPMDIVLAVDASTSMNAETSPGGPTKLAAALEAATWFVRQKAPTEQVAVIGFNSEAHLLATLTADLPALEAAIAAITPSPWTRMDLALRSGRQELASARAQPDAKRVLILLTDGQPTQTTPEEVLAEAALTRDAGVIVFTIGLGTDVEAAFLEAVAGDPGRALLAPDAADLLAIYQRIRETLPCP